MRYHAVETGCAWTGEVPLQPANNKGMMIIIPQAYLQTTAPNGVL